MATLASYNSIQSNIFVKLTVKEYRVGRDVPYGQNTLRFSDSLVDRTFNGEIYTAVGRLLGIRQSSSDLKVTGNQLNITLAGIPNTAISEIVNSKFKTSKVEVFRAFYDTATDALIPLAQNPIGRFIGIVSNYSLEEQWDSYNKVSNNTLILVCSSQVDILGKKIAGRCTSPSSMKKFFPNDASMDRVPVLEKATFDFGKQSTSNGSATASQQSGFDFINNL
jgi:hypothetical protein